MTIFADDFGTRRASIRKYSAIVRINMKNSVAYVWDSFSQVAFIALFVYIFAELWTVTFAAQNTTQINGLTLNQTIWYFVWAELIQLSKNDPVRTIQTEVKDGSLAYTLGRPYNYILYHFFRGIGGTAIRMIAILTMGSLVAFSQTGLMDSFRLEVMPLVLIVTLLAMVIDYTILACISLTAFFVEDAFAFRLIYSKIIFVIGGLLIPVDFLPQNVQSVVRYLPFNLVIYAPSKLFVSWDTTQFFEIVTLQVIWGCLLAGLLALFYRYGVRRVSINGG